MITQDIPENLVAGFRHVSKSGMALPPSPIFLLLCLPSSWITEVSPRREVGISQILGALLWIEY